MELKNIYGAFVKAQTGFAPALKTSTNPHFKSKYADLAACVEAVIDALNANGIGLVQKTHMDETGVTVETCFVHESGESFTGGTLHVPASKQDPQGYGSALSYARRYSLMAACGIAPEDDDGNAAKAPVSNVHKPTALAKGEMTQQQHTFVGKIAAAIGTKFGSGNDWGAFEEMTSAIDLINTKGGDADQFKIALYDVLPANQRSAIKSMEDAQQKKAA
jgi:hypothetical protein